MKPLKSLQDIVDLLYENDELAQEVIDHINNVVLKDWDIDKAIAEGKKQAELLKAGHKPSEVLKIMKEAADDTSWDVPADIIDAVSNEY